MNHRFDVSIQSFSYSSFDPGWRWSTRDAAPSRAGRKTSSQPWFSAPWALLLLACWASIVRATEQSSNSNGFHSGTSSLQGEISGVQSDAHRWSFDYAKVLALYERALASWRDPSCFLRSKRCQVTLSPSCFRPRAFVQTFPFYLSFSIHRPTELSFIGFRFVRKNLHNVTDTL